MLHSIRQRVTGRAGRLLLLLLALSLWPMASFGAMACCPEAQAEAVTDAAPSDAHAHHAMHGTPHGGADRGAAPSAMTECHEPEVVGHNHSGCDAECAARCATPSLFTTLSLWPAQGYAQQHRATWHASLPPALQGARLLRPPIHA